MKATLSTVALVCMATVITAGCGKKSDDTSATSGTPAANAPVAVPSTVPPAAQAQIQQGIERGKADGAAYAAQQKAHAAQQAPK